MADCCGMPLSKDEKAGGTEANGSKSAEYRSHYYAKGQFTDPNFTARQMVEKVKGKMKEMHFPGTKNIPKLKRWKGNQSTH